MNKILKYEEFNEGKLGRLAAGGALFASTLLGGCYPSGQAKLDKTEVISNQTFKEYILSAEGEEFDLSINGDFILAYHSYTTGSGKSSQTYTRNNIIMTKPVEFIWYKDKFFGNCIASAKNFAGADLIRFKEDLKKIEETPGYIIYRVRGAFSSINYVILIKDNRKLKGEEYTLPDQGGVYICNKINRDIYIFAIAGIGKGHFGGAGSGGDY